MSCHQMGGTPSRPGQPQAQALLLLKHSVHLPLLFKGLSSLGPLGSSSVTKETMMSDGWWGSGLSYHPLSRLGTMLADVTAQKFIAQSGYL